MPPVSSILAALVPPELIRGNTDMEGVAHPLGVHGRPGQGVRVQGINSVARLLGDSPEEVDAAAADCCQGKA